METESRKSYYVTKRERFNDLKVNGDKSINIEKAALMIFLNKTCFNGLFRVNKKGFFNVPMGAYKRPMICDQANLRAVSEKLQRVTIRCGDYKESADFIDDNTFVYFDKWPANSCAIVSNKSPTPLSRKIPINKRVYYRWEMQIYFRLVIFYQKLI